MIVVENENGVIIGTLQLSFLQYLTYTGGIRAQIEAVRIKESERGKGIGKEMFQWAIKRAKEKHENKYNYDLVHEFKNQHEQVWIECPIEGHGLFSKSPANHLHKPRPQGCPRCGAKAHDAELCGTESGTTSSLELTT